MQVNGCIIKERLRVCLSRKIYHRSLKMSETVEKKVLFEQGAYLHSDGTIHHTTWIPGLNELSADFVGVEVRQFEQDVIIFKNVRVDGTDEVFSKSILPTATKPYKSIRAGVTAFDELCDAHPAFKGKKVSE